jgi:hypothetical protein
VNRLTRNTVTIDRPFRFSNETTTHPAGAYDITVEEKQLGDVMSDAYRRISTRIHFPPTAGRTGIGEILEIDPAELDHLIQKQARD